MSKKELLLSKLETSKREVADAESELEIALRDMEVLPRAEKQAISQVLQDAFAKVRAAKTSLSDLESIIVSDDDA